MFFYTNPITEKLKVQKTKKKAFVIKKHKKSNKCKLSSTDAEINNNIVYLRLLVAKGFDKYEIHERLRTKFNIDFSYEVIEHYIEEYKSISLHYNENGRIKQNTELYKEVF